MAALNFLKLNTKNVLHKGSPYATLQSKIPYIVLDTAHTAS